MTWALGGLCLAMAVICVHLAGANHALRARLKFAIKDQEVTHRGYREIQQSHRTLVEQGKADRERIADMLHALMAEVKDG